MSNTEKAIAKYTQLKQLRRRQRDNEIEQHQLWQELKRMQDRLKRSIAEGEEIEIEIKGHTNE